MASLLGMTRAEKEEYVIQLRKAGRSVRQIAELVHMSFRNIGAITNNAKLQAEQERGYVPEDTQPKSPESRLSCFQRVIPCRSSNCTRSAR